MQGRPPQRPARYWSPVARAQAEAMPDTAGNTSAGYGEAALCIVHDEVVPRVVQRL